MTDFPTLLYTSTCDIPTLWYTWRLKKVPLSGGDPPLPPPPLGSLCRLYFACSEDYTSHIAIFRDGPLEKWWGVGNFRSLLVQEFFFAGENLCTNFFQTNIAFLLNSEILIHYLCFCTLQIIILHSHQIKGYRPLLNAKSFPKCTHSERGGSHLGWTASLCIVAVPSLWNSSPTVHHNDSIRRQPKQPLCSALHSKL